MDRLTTFTVGNKQLPVTFLNTEQVKDGVECDIYSFAGDTTKDLAIVRVQPGYRTPLQKVISGKQTIEGYVNGTGRLKIVKIDSEATYYEFAPENQNLPVSVQVGELMQWKAAGDSTLTFYELCTPPYEKGRFENQD
jgi:hypothetical protein